MNNNTVFRIVDGVKTREEEFGLLIVSKSTPALSLNHDGKAVWERINGKNSVMDIISSLSEEYNPSAVKEKVMVLFETFEKLGLIVKIE